MRKFYSGLTFLVVVLATTHGVYAEPKPLACYLPTMSNVSYPQVTDLPTSSPNNIIEYGKAALQFGELWLPRHSATNSQAPLVVLIHGGCWLNEYDIKHTHALSTALSQSGYAVWAVEYRRTGDIGGGWPGSYDDIKAAINFTYELSNYPINLEKIALVGHSAGGHLALLAGKELKADFAAVIGLAAIVDIKQYALGSNSCEIATPKFMSGTPDEKPDEYTQANPAKHTLHPKTVLIHGTADEIVAIKQSNNAAVPVRVIDGAGHFDMIHPGTKAYQQLLKELANAFK